MRKRVAARDALDDARARRRRRRERRRRHLEQREVARALGRLVRLVLERHLPRVQPEREVDDRARDRDALNRVERLERRAERARVRVVRNRRRAPLEADREETLWRGSLNGASSTPGFP